MVTYENLKGLSSEEVRISAEKYGKNTVTRHKRHSFIKQFISSFNDPIIKILLFTLFINALFWLRDFNPYEAIGIVSAILISTLISAISEYGSEGAFLSLLEESEKSTCTVIRGGELCVISSSELVCGDLVMLIPGERIYADGVIINGRINVNQSALNGESREVVKLPCKKDLIGDISSQNTLLSGVVICEGEGVMRVERVGDSTYYGKIAGELQMKGSESPLKEKLGKLAGEISKIGFISAFFVAFADIFNTVVIDNAYNSELILSFISNPSMLFSALLHALTLALTVVVVAAPEGLPMMIGVVLSANIKKMKNDNVLVRKPVGIETSGCMNILFTDKTGTLTYGRPNVTDVILANGNALSLSQFKSTDAYALFSECAGVNTSCKINGTDIIGGNSTDRALFTASDLKYTSGISIQNQTEFTSERKFSSVLSEKDGKKRFYIKGAYEVLISKCRKGIDKNGKIVSVDASFLKAVKEKAEMSNRLVLLAYSDENEDDLILICAAVMKDGLRNEAKSAVLRLHSAGVDVVMITGDSPETAKAVANQAGIITSSRRRIITGGEMAKMTDDELREALPEIAAVARAYPDDKSRLVRICMEDGLVTGMTGDGINDSPALKRADIGFAPGSASDVAKQASDIIILDDNIASITKAVMYGRTILRSIKKFLLFQLTMNFCAVGISLFAPLIGCETPVTVLQMLWINIIMDTLAGLAFAGEQAREEYMKVPPSGRTENVLTKSMICNIIYCGTVCVSLMLWYLTSDFVSSFFGGNTREFYCGFFGLFVFSGIFNCFNTRTHRLNLFSHLKENRFFMPIILLVIAVQLGLMYFGGSIFRCTPLNIYELIFIILLSSLIIPLDLIRKLLTKRNKI